MNLPAYGWRMDHGGGRPPQVIPIGDLREHVTDGSECWCGTWIDEVGTIVHEAADQRQKYERGERKPS